MHLLLIGSGKLAQAIMNRCATTEVPYSLWGEHAVPKQSAQNTVAIHVGSGRQLGEAIAFCEKENISLIQGSTGQETLLPQHPHIPIIVTPNFALPILSFIDLLPEVADTLFRSADMSPVKIIESHQSTKKTTPGTAVAMAKAIGLPVSAITSVRDTVEQQRLGVTPDFLDGHAYHWVTFEGDGVTITLSTQVNGREAYARGALRLAKKIIDDRSQLGHGIYRINHGAMFEHIDG